MLFQITSQSTVKT